MKKLQAKIAANIHSYCKTFRKQSGLNLARTHLPYLLQRTSKGWLVLNRYYKPLGMPNGEWVDYESPEFDDLRFSPRDVDVSGLIRVSDDCRYFFDGSCAPYVRDIRARWQYLQRVDQCFSLGGGFK